MLLQPEVQRQGAVEQPVAAESPASQSADASDLVLLADAEPGPVGARAPAPDATVPVLEPQKFVLDVRLVRGFSGAPPEEALLPPTAGAGGADPLADLSPTLAAVIPAPDYALIGRWRGDLEPGDRGAAISERYRLTYRVERTTTGLRLVDVHLLGGDAPRIADVIDLERNRLYVFGAGGGAPDLVLALRLQPVEPQE